jgi:hypothetical protein
MITLVLLLTAVCGNAGPATHGHDVHGSRSAPPTSRASGRNPGWCCAGCGTVPFFIVVLAVESLGRMDGDSSFFDQPVRRKPGEPLVPVVRGDAAYRWLEGGQSALDLRAEGGYGPFAVHVSASRCRLDGDTRDIVETLAGLRLSFGPEAEVDLAAGVLTQPGTGERAAFAVGLPVLIHPSRRAFGLELRPVVSSRLIDLDLAAFAHYRAVSVKAGYRTQFNRDDTFAGPYLGVTARY